MLSGFLGQLDKAFDFYAKVIDNVESTSHIGILARSSLLLLRLTQGSRVKLSSSEGHTGSPSPKKPSFDAEHSISSRPVATHYSEDFEDLEGYAKQILQDCDQRVPSLRILALILEALVNGEISKAK